MFSSSPEHLGCGPTSGHLHMWVLVFGRLVHQTCPCLSPLPLTGLCLQTTSSNSPSWHLKSYICTFFWPKGIPLSLFSGYFYSLVLILYVFCLCVVSLQECQLQDTRGFSFAHCQILRVWNSVWRYDSYATNIHCIGSLLWLSLLLK